MQEIIIRLFVPDGVTVRVENNETLRESVAAETKQPGPTGEQLRDALMKAFSRTCAKHGPIVGKEKTFAALGYAKAGDVPEAEYAATIERLNAVG